MAGAKKLNVAVAKSNKTVGQNSAPTDPLRAIGGTDHIAFNAMLMRQALASFPAGFADVAKPDGFDAVATGLIAIAPRDAHEGMIAVQMLGLHNATMECLKRAVYEGQTFEGREMNLTQAAKLSRSYALLMDCLGRHRGGGTQKIIVERVTVNAGGQAIVGNVAHVREGVPRKTEEQPHAKQIAHAPLTSLPGLNPSLDAVPVASYEKRPLPNARRPIARRTKG
ncbi:hypothetical protein GCM10011529_13170 [Polymorphobacter glacialis]|uniref:Uncharacterized protein n=1 Tax=Sandarakinorhabdus glacialis TaxID=1614636 RepID=A0A916ZPT0_9SPHN|nr:hypothetical protein [Polymorphobacter glacialis]GGE08115.1 hypothetical protein GCM10011529_13170 [Polymorphobacter glacialis]